MNRRTIGIVDYGIGNWSSVRAALNTLGYRCQISGKSNVLKDTDLLLLPGVGAFPMAMNALYEFDLILPLQEWAKRGKPMVGICLGMQLMADESDEISLTSGLGLIPGKVSKLKGSNWHIGWNTIESVNDDPLIKPSNGVSLYFNHSYVFNPPKEYRVAMTRLDSSSERFTIGIRRDNLFGLQCHPEKSQVEGLQLLNNIIEGLCRA